jgi:hypothetical protein
MKALLRLFVLAAALTAAALGASGCKTAESENLSERPWNAPRGWENGLPSGINQGR